MNNYVHLVFEKEDDKKEWYSLGTQYIAEFEKCKVLLPKRFVKLYERESFHDWRVPKIEFFWATKRNFPYSVKLTLINPYDPECFWGCEIVLLELYEFSMHYPKDNSYPECARMDNIMFMEITKEENLINLGINSASEAEFNFTFRKLQFKKLKTMPDDIKK